MTAQHGCISSKNPFNSISRRPLYRATISQYNCIDMANRSRPNLEGNDEKSHHYTYIANIELQTKTIFSKMYQLEILREDEERVTSLTFGRLFTGKMVTRRKQGGDACSDLGSLDARNKHSCAEESFFWLPKDDAK